MKFTDSESSGGGKKAPRFLNSGADLSSSLFPAPKTFLAGKVKWASHATSKPSFVREKTRVKGVRRQGINYEKKAQSYLKGLVLKEQLNNPARDTENYSYLMSPWLMFRSEKDNPGSIRFCQPDGIVVDLANKRIVIVEVKLQHTIGAWWQLRELYEPVLRRIYVGFEFSVVEVVRWFDPQVKYPESVFPIENPLEAKPGKFCVHIYCPYRGKR